MAAGGGAAPDVEGGPPGGSGNGNGGDAAPLLRQRRVGGASGSPSSPSSSSSRGPMPPEAKIIAQIKRSAILTASLWGLHRFGVYHAVLYSPDTKHMWFATGLASSIAILIIKSYVELYEGKTRKQKVSYETFRQTTHALIFLILFTSLAFHIALWPVYGAKSLFLQTLFGYGVLLQGCLLCPNTWIQNALGTVILTWFLQLYVSL